MESNIQDFLEKYFNENGLSRTHDTVRYVEHNFVEDDYDAEILKLTSGRMRAAFKVAAWLDGQKLTPLGKDGILVLADKYGQAFAVIKVSDVEIVKYGEVTEKMSQAFLIGDGSVENWKQVCHDFLNSECAQLTIDFNEDTEILITWFDKLYPE